MMKPMIFHSGPNRKETDQLLFAIIKRNNNMQKVIKIKDNV